MCRNEWLIYFCVAAVSVVMVPRANAFFIMIDDRGSGIPLVITDVPGASIAAGTESVVITGIAPLTTGGARCVQMTGLISGPDFVGDSSSDVTCLLGGPGTFTLTFQSDIFSPIPVPFTLIASLPEDGTFQLLPFGEPGLLVSVASDVGGTPDIPAIPEPAVIDLLAVGLLGVTLMRRKSGRMNERAAGV